MKTALDLEERGGLIEDFWRKEGDLHDLLASAGAGGDGLEDFGLDIGVADEVLGFETFVNLGVIVREEFHKNIGWLGVGNSALLNELVATLRIGVRDVARDGEDGFALIEGVGSSIKGTGALGRLHDHDEIREARDDAVAL